MSDLCGRCVHGQRMQPGAYQTVNGSLIINGGQVWMCSNNGVMDLDLTTNDMRCSRFEAKEGNGELVDYGAER